MNTDLTLTEVYELDEKYFELHPNLTSFTRPVAHAEFARDFNETEMGSREYYKRLLEIKMGLYVSLVFKAPAKRYFHAIALYDGTGKCVPDFFSRKWMKSN
jgi:hypothetical protein